MRVLPPEAGERMTCCQTCKITEASCEARPGRCCQACSHDGVVSHFVVKYASSDGWVATCRCSWRVCRRDREVRDRDAAAHGGAE